MWAHPGQGTRASQRDVTRRAAHRTCASCSSVIPGRGGGAEYRGPLIGLTAGGGRDAELGAVPAAVLKRDPAKAGPGAGA